MSTAPERQNDLVGAKEVPSRLLPVPDTVSPEMQAIIARPLDPTFNIAPKTTADWRTRVDTAARTTVAALPQLREALGVTVEPTTMAGVVPACPQCNGKDIRPLVSMFFSQTSRKS